MLQHANYCKDSIKMQRTVTGSSQWLPNVLIAFQVTVDTSFVLSFVDSGKVLGGYLDLLL